MFYSVYGLVAVFVATALASPAQKGTNNAAADGSTSTTLLDSVIQSGSGQDGSNGIGAAETGQAKSATSTNNFINICSGKTLTNGLQVTTGSCNGIPMGDIPAKSQMVSSIIISPQHNQADIESDTTFNITVQMSNIVAGSFTNADLTYYAAPQALSGGKVVGHTHVTVQDLGNDFNPTTPLDPTVFAFFKGINDAGNGQGLLSATVTGGLPAGNYRVCTLASASNHQPVLMPVAQRGSADDCTKFKVIGKGTTANANANNGANGISAASVASAAAASVQASGNNQVAVTASTSAAATTSTSAATTTTKAGKTTKTTSLSTSSTTATTTSAATDGNNANTNGNANGNANTNNNTNNGGGGGGGNGRGRGKNNRRFASREFIA